MRHRISLAFYCLASVIILLQLSTSFMAMIGDNDQHAVIHSVTRQVEPVPVKTNEAPKIDFKQMAKDLAQEKY
ncbi:hypothetical protein L4D09_00615 [Photobacterium makurazakiensis]|uniref:hypothetical protein n=1 Tax=Photobacterium makurazakiensis TaxID=2910234 RepID=UPI003D097C78